MQMPEAATADLLQKKVFLKILQNSPEIPVPEETPVTFATPFLQNNFGRLLLKADIAITKREIKIVFVVGNWMQCLLPRLKSQSMREESQHPTFMGISPSISNSY